MIGQRKSAILARYWNRNAIRYVPHIPEHGFPQSCLCAAPKTSRLRQVFKRARIACEERQGLTEGAQALVRRAFAEPDTAQVVSCALIDNVTSWRVMEKVGLQRVGLFALPGYEPLAVKYALARA